MEEYHIIPEYDLRHHAPSKQCWCCPILDDSEYPNYLYIHNSMDRREEYEEGRKMS